MINKSSKYDFIVKLFLNNKKNPSIMKNAEKKVPLIAWYCVTGIITWKLYFRF